ncbi:MAG: amidohydrolase family protein [Myxococcales bacterium]|nr:amidohydrolase family protein [Myxococcales bacterium]
MTTLILADRAVLGGDPLRIESVVITVRDALIEAVAPLDRAHAPVAKPGETVVDVGERLVTPAFVNGHTHLAMAALRGVGLEAMDGNIIEEIYFRVEGALTAEDVRAFTRMGACESLLAGVGAVWDHYYHGEAVAAALAEMGLCGVVAPTLQDLAGPGVVALDAQFEATERIATDEKLAAAGIFAALGPHATDTVSGALWTRINAVAERHTLPIHAHVAQSIEEYERAVARHGQTPIAWLDGLGVLDAGAGMLLVHGLYATRADLARLRPARNTLAYCPFSQVQFGFPAAVEGWWKAGVPFVIGTDCGACNDSMSPQQELRLLAGGRAFAVTPSPEGMRFRETGAAGDAQGLDAIRRATREERAALADPATLLGTVWRVPGQMHPRLMAGEIAAGARASLCVWDADHPAWWPTTAPLRTLTMGDVSGALWGLLVNGRWVGERGAVQSSLLASDDWREARAEAEGRLRALFARVGL